MSRREEQKKSSGLDAVQGNKDNKENNCGGQLVDEYKEERTRPL